MANSGKRHRVVVVGAGFAGFNAARELSRQAAATTEIIVINSTDYFLYLPLMPQVAAGLSSQNTSGSRWPPGCGRCGSCSAPRTTSTRSRRRWAGPARRARPARSATTGSS